MAFQLPSHLRLPWWMFILTVKLLSWLLGRYRVVQRIQSDDLPPPAQIKQSCLFCEEPWWLLVHFSTEIWIPMALNHWTALLNTRGGYSSLLLEGFHDTQWSRPALQWDLFTVNRSLLDFKRLSPNLIYHAVTSSSLLPVSIFWKVELK